MNKKTSHIKNGGKNVHSTIPLELSIETRMCSFGRPRADFISNSWLNV